MADLKKLTLADIIGADDMPTKEVAVPEWGGVVVIKGMSGQTRDAWQKKHMKLTPRPDGGADVSYTLSDNETAELIARSVVDPADPAKLMFADGDAVKKLGGKSAIVLDKLALECRRINGLDDDAVEDAAKNSEATTKNGPGSD